MVSLTLPKRLFARPGPALIGDGHLPHPVGEPRLGILGHEVAPRVVDENWQQRGHFLLEAGSLLGQPGAQAAECGENKRVAVATGVQLEKQEMTGISVSDAHRHPKV